MSERRDTLPRPILSLRLNFALEEEQYALHGLIRVSLVPRSGPDEIIPPRTMRQAVDLADSHLPEPRMPSKNLIVFRTHFLDQRLLGLIESIRSAPDYEVVVAADEIGRTVEAHGVPKISMTAALFDALGLFTELGDMLWRCGDYPLYLARQAYPDAVNYWLIEYDVAINRPDPVGFFREHDTAYAHDLLSTHFREREPGWHWGDPMQGEYAVVWRSYFPLVRLSGRAIDFLLERRVLASNRIRTIASDFRPEWPNDEAFVACELHYNGFQCADFAALGDCYDRTTFFNDVLIHPDQLPPYDGKIYHMVRWDAHYLKAVRPGLNDGRHPTLRDLAGLTATGLPLGQIVPVLKEQIVFALGSGGDTPERVLAPDGPVMTLLADDPPALVLQAVVMALARLRMRLSIDALGRIATRRAWPAIEQFSNVALARPAWQSSTSPWSNPHDYRLDAEGGNNGNRDVDHGFHTGGGSGNYWAVDLQQSILLTEVRIYNRHAYAGRLDGFRLLASLDGEAWHLVYRSPPEIDLARTVGEPIRIPLFTPARLLRVESQEDDYFHFREFEAYGMPMRDKLS